MSTWSTGGGMNVTATLTPADVAMLEMCATRGVEYLPYDLEDEEEDVD